MIDDPKKVAKFDDRDGYDLVDYSVVGLPIWILLLEVKIKEKASVSLLEQALISLVHAGIRKEADLGMLTGLNEGIVRFYLGELMARNFIDVTAGEIRCTGKGDTLAKDKSVLTSISKEVNIAYDPFLQDVILGDKQDVYWRPSELKHLGVMMLRPSPQRRPFPEELDVSRVSRFLDDSDEKFAGLIGITRVISRQIRFVKALMLIYKESRSGLVEVEFAIDSRISKEHGRAFVLQKGLVLNGIKGGVSEGGTLLKDNSAISGMNSMLTEARKNRNDASERGLVSRQTTGALMKKEVSSTRDTLPQLEQRDSDGVFKTNTQEYGLVSVYEHPLYLEQALESAESQIIIISPWITEAVVDAKFISTLTYRLREGVEVFIGYGITKDERSNDVNNAVRSLRDLALDNARFHFKRLGDTHAKVLVKDLEFLIASSFNWLSFKGDPNRTFREEWGVCIRRKDFVQRESQKFRNRFS